METSSGVRQDLVKLREPRHSAVPAASAFRSSCPIRYACLSKDYWRDVGDYVGWCRSRHRKGRHHGTVIDAHAARHVGREIGSGNLLRLDRAQVGRRIECPGRAASRTTRPDCARSTGTGIRRRDSRNGVPRYRAKMGAPAWDRRRVGCTYLNGRGERIRADTPSPFLLIPVANIPSYVGRVWKTA